MGLGPMPGQGGWMALFDSASNNFAFLRWARVAWNQYNRNGGGTRPACGDLDADGKDELVVGLDDYPVEGGWFLALDDLTTGLARLQWRRVPWSSYNATNGATRPACGDIDGDRISEVIVGLGDRGLGWLCTFGDLAAGLPMDRWLRVPWQAYNAAGGETRPALGDPDGDGQDELLIGLGRYPSSGGWLHCFDDASGGYAPLGWTRVQWSAYNSSNGETWPAFGAVR